VGKLSQRFSDLSALFDTHVIDATVNGLGAVTDRVGAAVRTLQTGRVQNYLLLVLVTVSVLLAAFFLLPK
jgi:NADH:ubiquinone oxidoreductase subunit 5 (subunit L)/multisubunit Na+/H+ antiporter MnhA subunit